MRIRRFWRLEFILFACLMGCHGGGSGSQSALPSTLGSTRANATGTASFSVMVPATGPASESLVVRVVNVNGGIPPAVAPVTMNLTARTPGCSPVAGGTLRCTASIAVPAGSDTFSVITYALPNGAGTALSTTQTTTTISPAGKTWCTPSEAHAAGART